VTVEPVDLARVTDDALRSAPAHGDIDVRVRAGLGALADAGRLRQVLRNLIVNAQRHGGSRIRVFGASIGEDVELVIADSGPEIRAAVQAKMFDAYVRGNRQSKGPDSVGLGLTVSRTLSRLMGGDVEYRYRNGWSEFAVRLPAVQTPEPRLGVVVDDRESARQLSHDTDPTAPDQP
jgi:signal transduction histidine kinase